MSYFKVFGGKRLCGEIEPSGSKNASLPIIFASLATCGISELKNVPDIGDVRVAIKIIESFGAKVKRAGNTLCIDTRNVFYTMPDKALTSSIRASSYLIGSCVARFGVFHLSEFGGCNFCNRPIDMHLFAAASLGAEISSCEISAIRLAGAKIYFDKPSVGATINALIMALSACGESEIFGAAKEPHVKALVDYLISAGADIEEIPFGYKIRKSELHGGTLEVLPDMIEAGTYMLLAPMTEGRITVRNAAKLELDSFFETITDAGIGISIHGEDVTVYGEPQRPFLVTTAPHPGYPTDLQPQTAPLMSKYFGGIINENVWQSRFSYLDSLGAFGVRYKTMSSRAEVYHSKLYPAETFAPDLRGGAAAVMCALTARGESTIKNAEIILRGYSDFESKLRRLGANVLYKE
ncbi:MAG: UDP-N-acetylglucosamine 1-carboxyvinyltransferase [Clostridia bacterium]|nr:UDP-N-acetylglucosamine 1-carboxyvinyltransferase [Clostridia bacterium]